MARPLSLCVAICTYNGQRYLQEQLASITAQTRLPDQLIATDDCSSDDTVKLLREFQRAAPFPVGVLVNPENLGYVKNFEKAIGLCPGDIVVLSDQDDVWKPERLAETERFFVKNPEVDAVFSNAELVDESLQPFSYDLWEAIEFTDLEKRSIETGDASRVLLRRNVVTGATMAFRGQLKSRLLPIPPIWVHDEWLAAIIAATGIIQFIPNKLIYYRQHSGNQIGARKLSPSRKLGLLFTKRESFHKNLLWKTGMLHERLATLLPAEHPLVVELGKKLMHLKTRANLQPSRLSRISSVVTELVQGNYFRYSSGWKSVVRDLFEPL